jgi:uncharacterized protein (DUF488 family)
LKEIYTIGHSNRSIEEFKRLLIEHSVEVLADVRRFPSSKYEHFNQDKLKKSLKDVGIDYIWFEGLGGYRKKILENSPNTAIKSRGFRNYADYMLTKEFREEVEKLIEIAEKRKVAIMCSEKFFWKCHRKFISDYLTLRGFIVIHIINDVVKEHRLSREARVTNIGLIYDVEL